MAFFICDKPAWKLEQMSVWMQVLGQCGSPLSSLVDKWVDRLQEGGRSHAAAPRNARPTKSQVKRLFHGRLFEVYRQNLIFRLGKAQTRSNSSVYCILVFCQTIIMMRGPSVISDCI